MHQNIENIFNLAVEETKQRFSYDNISSEEGDFDHILDSKFKVISLHFIR